MRTRPREKVMGAVRGELPVTDDGRLHSTLVRRAKAPPLEVGGKLKEGDRLELAVDEVLALRLAENRVTLYAPGALSLPNAPTLPPIRTAIPGRPPSCWAVPRVCKS